MATHAFDLPETVIAVLPNDPFEQLDIARKITSVALASRISILESEVSDLEEGIAQRDDIINDLNTQVGKLDASLADLSRTAAQAEEEKAKLVEENAMLSNTVKKLNRDVSKLEVFKKALMQSLNEEEDGSQARVPKVIPRIPSEEDVNSSLKTRFSETGSSVSEDAASSDADDLKQGTQQYNIHIPSLSTTPRLASLNTTPKLTPPGSPPRSTAALSPPRLSKPISPRRHSIAISSRRSVLEDRSSAFSSVPSHHNSMTSPFDSGSHAGRTRVDGKEFFRQVRSRLSYEQFSSFLANVKELNSHKQTREETLHKAEEMFGADNKDLYAIFEGLITRNVH